jgi:transcriptional regulator GlxA family with amidase domain
MLERVAVIASDGVAPFELGVLCEVFGTDRSSDGLPRYDFAICSHDGRSVRTSSGFTIAPHGDLGPLERADLVAVPAHPVDGHVPQTVLAALQRAADRGARLLSVCSGAFVLGEAGLLDGRRCTTHWRYVDDLQRRFPAALVQCESLYVEDGRILTSAGTAAGIDACLHLVRAVHGADIAVRLARRMVVPPHRDGGQAQYIEQPIAVARGASTLEPLLSWVSANLHVELDVDYLASRAHMAPRTFARRFRAEVGTTPHDWLVHQRVLLARRLLEETDLGVESIAARAGFGDAAALRHHFTRRVGTTPHAYRTTFRHRPATSATRATRSNAVRAANPAPPHPTVTRVRTRVS